VAIGKIGREMKDAMMGSGKKYVREKGERSKIDDDFDF
jgi:hypothetical protein